MPGLRFHFPPESGAKPGTVSSALKSMARDEPPSAESGAASRLMIRRVRQRSMGWLLAAPWVVLLYFASLPSSLPELV